MKSNYELSVVIPAYNERKNLPYIIREYKDTKKNVRFQLVIVDNGSRDGTAEYLKEITKKKGNEFIKVVTVQNNIGYGHGIHQGLLQCDADTVGWSHGDMQSPPVDTFKAYELYKKSGGNKVLVKGHRIGRPRLPLFVANCLTLYSSVLLLTKFDDINGQPKIFDKGLLKSFSMPPKDFSYDLYVQYKALQQGYEVHHFIVYFLSRAHGISKAGVNFRKKAPVIKQYAIDVLKMGMKKIR